MTSSPAEILRRVFDISPMDCARAARNYIRRLELRHTGSRLTDAEVRDLQQMRDDNRVAGPPFTPSAHWQEVTQIFDAFFHQQGIQNPEEQPFNLRFSGFACGDARLHRYVCWMYRCSLKRRDKLGLLDRLGATCKDGRGFGYRFGEEYLSLDLLLSIDDFYNIYEVYPKVLTEPVIIGELGAGWGRLAYVIKNVNPRAIYVIFDLPEPLLISQEYLSSLFQNVTVSRYQESRFGMQFSRDSLPLRDFWFCGPQQMTRFDSGSLDIVINIGSFQEMPLDYVKQYMGIFNGIAKDGYCYMRQLREGRSHDHRYDEIEGLGSYPFPKHWRQIYCRTSTLSDEFFEVTFKL